MFRTRVLKALPSAPPGLTATELVTRHGVPAPIIYVGTLSWLRHNGYVVRSGSGQRGDPYRYWRGDSRPVDQPKGADETGDRTALSEEEGRFRSALDWLAKGALPLPHGGVWVTDGKVAEFASDVLSGSLSPADCPWCRDDGFGCPACRQG